jgi:hypothetical protein
MKQRTFSPRRVRLARPWATAACATMVHRLTDAVQTGAAEV